MVHALRCTLSVHVHTVRVDKKLKRIVVHWDIAFGGFLYIGYTLRKCQYTASWANFMAMAGALYVRF